MTEPQATSPSDWLLPEGEPMAIDDIRDALVIREGSVFMLTDARGAIPVENRQGFGIYHADTRHLSAFAFSLDGVEPVPLLASAELGFAMEQVFTNPRLVTRDGRVLEKGAIGIRRQIRIGRVFEERLQITNYSNKDVPLTARYDLAADFADIFDVRGYQRKRKGKRATPDVGERSVAYRYDGIDGRARKTEVVFSIAPDELTSEQARFHIDLAPRADFSARILVLLDSQSPQNDAAAGFRAVRADHAAWRDECTSAVTDNELFNRVLDRSLADLRMLWSQTEEGERYPAAGTPWFDALFGRDSCIVSLQSLAFNPAIARASLRVLARLQGLALVPQRDEEPGKILHELRSGELSRAGELPFGPYYGSVDSTPLFLLLVSEYYAWTGDAGLARELLPQIKLALQWLEIYGDPLSTGHLRYEKRSSEGLVNQGWKDSWDAILHRDGALASPPIALAEVQGYVYAARAGLAPVLDRLGERTLAQRMRELCEEQWARFNRDYWLEEEQYYAVALERDFGPVASITSNPGHCLWSELIDSRRAPAVAERLLGPSMFTGWGIRTLSSDHPRYNPNGYHTGSVWPHDNSLIAAGLKRYGFEEHLNRVATSLFEAAVAFPYFRLPELFAGDARGERRAPTPYPVACKPQAWAAGAIPFVLQAMLGLRAEAPERRLRIVNPRLPSWLSWVQLRDLRVGQGAVTVQFRRTGRSTSVEVQKTSGVVDVVVSKRWPRARG